jgi:hypothetical protein
VTGQPSLDVQGCFILTDRVPPQADPSPRFPNICATFCIVGGVSPRVRGPLIRLAARRDDPLTVITTDDTCVEPALAFTPSGGGHVASFAGGNLPGNTSCNKSTNIPATNPPASFSVAETCSVQFIESTNQGNVTYTANGTTSFSYDVTGSPGGGEVHFIGSSSVSVGTTNASFTGKATARAPQDRRACFVVPTGRTVHYSLTGQLQGTTHAAATFNGGYASAGLLKVGNPTPVYVAEAGTVRFSGQQFPPNVSVNASGTLSEGSYCLSTSLDVEVGNTATLSSSGSFDVRLTITP